MSVSSTLHLSMTSVAFFASPSCNMSQNSSQMFGVDEAALQEDLIDFNVVPGLKQNFVDENNDLVLY